MFKKVTKKAEFKKFQYFPKKYKFKKSLKAENYIKKF